MGVNGEDCMLVSGLIIEDSINIPRILGTLKCLEIKS